APRDAQPGSSSLRTTIEVSRSTPIAGLRAAIPRTLTRPSLIKLTACSRDRASPRRTSSASSRALRALADTAGSDLVDGRQCHGELGVHRVETFHVLAQRQVVQVVQTGHRL